MKDTYVKKLICAISFLLFSCRAFGCAPMPDNGEIEAAIRMSLAAEASPPALVFADCDFDDKLPDYEIHIALQNGKEHFFTTREQLLKRFKD